MSALKKVVVASIPFTVLLCFTYGHMPDVKTPLTTETTKERTIQRIVEHLEGENANLNFDDDDLRRVARILYEESKQYDVDYRLVLAVIKVESNFKPDAVSSRGARGLLQLKPSVAKFIAGNVGIKWQGSKTLDEPEKNIKIGIHHLSGLIDDFESLHMALHAYHVGPSRLKELLSEKGRLNKRFLNLVLAEYSRNRSILPNP